MIDAIEARNEQLMNDILERYHGSLNVGIDENNNNLLILCAIMGNSRMLNLLLIKGCEVNWRNNDGNTALHYSLAYKHNHCVDLLIQWGADRSILDEWDY